MIKLRHLVLSLTAFAVVGWSDTLDPADLLQRSAQFVRTATTISLDFELIQHYQTGDSLRQQGTLLLGGEERFVLKLSAIEYISDGKTLWEYRKGAKQALARPLAEMSSGFHPSKMLFQYLECSPLSAKSVAVNGKKQIHLKLNPEGKLASLKEFEVWLNPTNWAPQQLRAVDASGNRSRYLFQNIKRNLPLSTEQFQFTPPPSVELLDLR